MFGEEGDVREFSNWDFFFSNKYTNENTLEMKIKDTPNSTPMSLLPPKTHEFLALLLGRELGAGRDGSIGSNNSCCSSNVGRCGKRLCHYSRRSAGTTLVDFYLRELL